MDDLTKQEIIRKGLLYAKDSLVKDIVELEDFLAVRDYSKGQRANLEKKLERMRQLQIELRSLPTGEI